MAKSRFEYVRNYELPDNIMPNTFIVVRIDGRGFHKFSDTHSFAKPNDKRALDLMDLSAKTVMNEYKDVIMAFGESDEYSFLLKRNTKLYNRRRSKISSSIVSLFTSSYVFNWTTLFPNQQLEYPPSFDSRVVVYPTEKEIRDYFAWRQADTHINNLYNTAFWALVQDGQSTTEANKTLQGTDSKDKNELLFTKFGINYNNIPAMYRKGSVCVRDPLNSVTPVPIASAETSNASSSSLSVPSILTTNAAPQQPDEDNDSSAFETLNGGRSELVSIDTEAKPGPDVKHSNRKLTKNVKIKPYEGIDGELVIVHEDIIKDGFWNERPWLLI